MGRIGRQNYWYAIGDRQLRIGAYVGTPRITQGQSGRSRGCAPSPQNRLKRINKKIYTISFRFLQALETRRNNIKKKLNKNYKKIEKLSKTEQKLQKKHPYYLPVFVENYFDKEKY